MPLTGPTALAFVRASAINSGVNVGGETLLKLASSVDQHELGLFARGLEFKSPAKEPAGLLAVLTDVVKYAPFKELDPWSSLGYERTHTHTLMK